MSGDHMSSLPAVNVKGQLRFESGLSGAGVAVDHVLLQCCPGHDGLSQSLGPVNALEYGSDVKGGNAIAPPSQRPGPILASVPVASRLRSGRVSRSVRSGSDMISPAECAPFLRRAGVGCRGGGGSVDCWIGVVTENDRRVVAPGRATECGARTRTAHGVCRQQDPRARSHRPDGRGRGGD